MQNENRLVPDFREETVQTYTETYTPEGGTEQTATYKIGTAHPIIGGILDKLTWVRTHAAAVWWNKLAGVTLKNKIDTMDESIAQLNSKMIITSAPTTEQLKSASCVYIYAVCNNAPIWGVSAMCAPNKVTQTGYDHNGASKNLSIRWSKTNGTISIEKSNDILDFTVNLAVLFF